MNEKAFIRNTMESLSFDNKDMFVCFIASSLGTQHYINVYTLFRWGTHFYMSLFLSVHPSVCRAAYLKNHTSSDHNFWYTYVK